MDLVSERCHVVSKPMLGNLASYTIRFTLLALQSLWSELCPLTPVFAVCTGLCLNNGDSLSPKSCQLSFSSVFEVGIRWKPALKGFTDSLPVAPHQLPPYFPRLRYRCLGVPQSDPVKPRLWSIM